MVEGSSSLNANWDRSFIWCTSSIRPRIKHRYYIYPSATVLSHHKYSWYTSDLLRLGLHLVAVPLQLYSGCGYGFWFWRHHSSPCMLFYESVSSELPLKWGIASLPFEWEERGRKRERKWEEMEEGITKTRKVESFKLSLTIRYIQTRQLYLEMQVQALTTVKLEEHASIWHI